MEGGDGGRKRKRRTGKEEGWKVLWRRKRKRKSRRSLQWTSQHQFPFLPSLPFLLFHHQRWCHDEGWGLKEDWRGGCRERGRRQLGWRVFHLHALPSRERKEWWKKRKKRRRKRKKKKKKRQRRQRGERRGRKVGEGQRWKER